MQVRHWTCLAVLTILAKKSSSRKLAFRLCLSYLNGAQETGAQGPHPEQRNLEVEMNRRVRTAMVMVITVTCQVPRAGGLTSCQALC